MLTMSSAAVTAQASPGKSGAFPDETLSDWKEESFVGNTSYQLLDYQGASVLQATTRETASLLYKEETIDLTQRPWLEWSWKTESVYKDIDEKSKSGDDFPARLYVTVQTGFLPWESLTINYVWASGQPVHSHWHSPYTNKSIMVAVQSGERNVGLWVTQRRNVVDDFKRLFDIDAERISGYAVMVDGDNSAQTSTAYFGNIQFRAD